MIRKFPGIANYSSTSRSKKKSSVFVLEDALPRTDENPKYENCQSCYSVGILSRLKDRILLDDEGKLLPTPLDNENYLQCWNCGHTVSVREVKREGKISGISGIKPIDNPNDFGKSRIATIGTDGLKGSMERIRKRQQRAMIDDDDEIQAFLDKGYELKSYSKTMT